MKILRNLLGVLLILTAACPFNSVAFADDGDGAESAGSEAHGAASGWSNNFEASLDEAGKTDKLVLADFYTSWCGWCKRLDQTTFADPAFMQYVKEHFVPVKLNAEDKGEGQRTAEKNDVSAYPTGLVFSPNGKVVGRIFGYFDASQYKAKLMKFAKHAPKHKKS